MAKVIVVALFVLALSALGYSDSTCSRCGYVKKHTTYPQYSKQLEDVVNFTSKRLNITLSANDKLIINKIVDKESDGRLTAYNNGCYGLGQGKQATYTSLNIPWRTTCPSDQVEMIIRYIRNRYGTFDKAWEHHKRKNWY
jgi:hypothetical protein